MLEHGTPPGENVMLLAHMYDEYEIHYDAILPKRLQPKEVKKERACKKVISRLIKAGLIEPVFLTPRPNPVLGYHFFRLTEKGRRMAEEIRRKHRDSQEMAKDVEKAVQLLRAQGFRQATFNQIRELLWRLSHEKFASREEFEAYWNRTRLGLSLRGLGVNQVRKRQGGRIKRVYLV